MSYDIRPLVTLEEKEQFFSEVVEKNQVLFLEHDPVHECIRLNRDERGRFTIASQFALQSLTV
jgi:hypothetical protein